MTLIVVSATGEDEPGLVAKITKEIADRKYNIIDIEETVVRGLFSIILIVEIPDAEVANLASLRETYQQLEKRTRLLISVKDYKEGRRPAESDFSVITIIGKDRPGIVARMSGFLYSKNVNINRIKMIARGDFIAMELHVDIKGLTISKTQFREELKFACGELDLGVIFQPEARYNKAKKLIIFDMDSTLVEGETILQIAEGSGTQKQVAEITEKASNGQIDFRQALKDRVKLLKGIPVSFLEKVANQMTLTPGAEELIQALKLMGYKIALISGGFTYFTDRLKERLGLDYAFGNKLVIDEANGVLTGEVVDDLVIDAKKKAEILTWLAKVENVSKDEIVAVGDSETDRIMIQNAGLSIGFNPKKILSIATDGNIKQNIFSIIYSLGIPDKKLQSMSQKLEQKDKK
jgi:phosphoserine phosphatase